MFIDSMSFVRIALFFIVGLLSCIGCQREHEPISQVKITEESTTNSNPEFIPTPIFVETYLDTKTAGVQTLAMLAQEDIEPYVISLVRRPEVINAAVYTLKLSSETRHITASWIQENIMVSTPNPHTTCIGMNTTELSQLAAIAAVEAVSKAFITLERNRVQAKIDSIMQSMKEKIGPSPTPEQAQVKQVWQRLIESRVFEKVPTVISNAQVIDNSR